MNKTKKCSACKTTKSVTQFSKNAREKDGLDVYCKVCRGKLSAQYRKDHPDYHREYYLRVTVPKRQAATAERRRQKDLERAEELERLAQGYRDRAAGE